MIKNFKKIDVFGKSVELTFRQKKTHKTNFGATLTICLVVTCFLGGRSISSDFLSKNDPTLNFSQILADDSLEVGDQMTNLNLQFYIYNTSTNKIVDTKEMIANHQIEVHVYCQNREIDIVFDQSGTMFSLNQLSSMHLVDSLQVSIKGAHIEEYTIVTTFSQYLFCPDSFEEPFQQSEKKLSFSLKYEGKLVYFSIIEISTDHGQLLPDFQNSQNLVFSHSEALMIGQQQNQSSFVFRVDKTKVLYKRKYLKIQSVLALIGGLLKTLMVIGNFVSKPIQKLSIKASIVGELFNFSQIQKQQKKVYNQKSLINLDLIEEKQALEQDVSPVNKQQSVIRLKEHSQKPYLKRDSIQSQANEDAIKRIQTELQIQIQNKLGINSQYSRPSSFQSPQIQKPALLNMPSQLPIFSNLESKQIGIVNENFFKAYKPSPIDSHTQGIQHYPTAQERYLSPQKQIFNNSKKQAQLSNSVDIQSKSHQKNNTLKAQILRKQSESDPPTIQINDQQNQENNGLAKKKSSSKIFFADNHLIPLQLNMSEIHEAPPELENKSKQFQISDNNKIIDISDNQVIQGIQQQPKKQVPEIEFSILLEAKKKEMTPSSQGGERHKNFPKSKTEVHQYKSQLKGSKQIYDNNSILANGKVQKVDNEVSNDNNQNNKDGSLKIGRRMSESRIELPSLKKENTQFVADLICLRVQERTSSQSKYHLKKSNSNPLNKLKSKSTSNLVNDKENQDAGELEGKMEDLNMNRSKKPSLNSDNKIKKKFHKTLEEKKSKSFKLTFIDYLKYFTCKNDPKKRQIKECTKKINQRLDIVYILNKLVEIDKLKMLLLDHNQRELFEFLPRPVVLQKERDDEDDDETEKKYNIQDAWNLLQEEKSTIDKATDACISYKVMKQKPKKNVMDQRLLEMLDLNIRHVFDSTPIPQDIIDEKNMIYNQIKQKQNYHQSQTIDLFNKTNIQSTPNERQNKSSIKKNNIQPINNSNTQNRNAIPFQLFPEVGLSEPKDNGSQNPFIISKASRSPFSSMAKSDKYNLNTSLGFNDIAWKNTIEQSCTEIPEEQPEKQLPCSTIQAKIERQGNLQKIMDITNKNEEDIIAEKENNQIFNLDKFQDKKLNVSYNGVHQKGVNYNSNEYYFESLNSYQKSNTFQEESSFESQQSSMQTKIMSKSANYLSPLQQIGKEELFPLSVGDRNNEHDKRKPVKCSIFQQRKELL